MSKELFEFYCSGGCQGYFRTKLRTNIDGNYTIVCPSCEHEHFRQVRKGQITGDRCISNSDKIVVPISAFSEEPIMEHPEGGEEGYDSAVRVDGHTKRWLLWGRYAKEG